MLSVYVPGPQGLVRASCTAATIPDEAIWIDLLDPTQDEEKQVEARLGIEVPTREEMLEIEASSRLYEESGALYMTATVVTKLDTELPVSSQVTFILAGARLVTNRYVDPLPFRRFASYAERHTANCNTAPAVLAGILEAIINRIADVIERVGSDLDRISGTVFINRKRRNTTADFRKILERVGQSGEIISKARESLVSLGRLLIFLQQAASQTLAQDVRARYRTLGRDVLALSDHASFLGNKNSFILDATLGMISIDQNDILKIFSLVTTFFLPPSVIGAIYGMNFERIPWSHEPWGFAAALVLMVVSALVPYLVFKRRGWL
ncbi:MAG TPA: magnesium transporter CorA family protein [Steroidobacteraceae bacterium]